jgi:hypothetical protein
MNTNFNCQLFECSFLIVSLLLEEYKKKMIDITDFKVNTEIKISYIQKNLEYIKEEDWKLFIENLINECVEINSSTPCQ